MSDFLLRLSARLLSEPLAEAAPALEPRSAGRFEPVGEGHAEGGEEFALVDVDSTVPAPSSVRVTRTIELTAPRIEQVRSEPRELSREPSAPAERRERVAAPVLPTPAAPEPASAPAARVPAPIAPRPPPGPPPFSLSPPPAALVSEPSVRHEAARAPVVSQVSAPQRGESLALAAPAAGPVAEPRPAPPVSVPRAANEPRPRLPPAPSVAPAPASSAPPSAAPAFEPVRERPAASTTAAPLIPPPLVERVTERVLERVSVEALPVDVAEREASPARWVVAEHERASKRAAAAPLRPVSEREAIREQASRVEAGASEREPPPRLVSSALGPRVSEREPALAPRAVPQPPPVERQPPPEIHIEIGRIVVQANTPQRAPEPRRMKLQQPRLDLSAYLARRDRSSR